MYLFTYNVRPLPQVVYWDLANKFCLQNWGKCKTEWMTANGYCSATCGFCASLPNKVDFDSTQKGQEVSRTSSTNDEYIKVLGLSWLFYEAQRSGKLPANNRVSWRGDSHLNDKVPGGWYDAGDHLKLNFPLATSAAFLSWGLLEFKNTYITAGELQHAQEGIRWVTDYLMACHQNEYSYVGQIGDPGPDHAFWGRPEDQSGSRPYFVWDSAKPGSELIGAAASALASASLVFEDIDPEYAAECLHHARQLYNLASKV